MLWYSLSYIPYARDVSSCRSYCPADIRRSKACSTGLPRRSKLSGYHVYDTKMRDMDTLCGLYSSSASLPTSQARVCPRRVYSISINPFNSADVDVSFTTGFGGNPAGRALRTGSGDDERVGELRRRWRSAYRTIRKLTFFPRSFRTASMLSHPTAVTGPVLGTSPTSRRGS